jgi:hypothetical protein
VGSNDDLKRVRGWARRCGPRDGRGVADDFERVGLGQERLGDADALVDEHAAQLGGDGRRGVVGEHEANRAVKVEQDIPGPGHDGGEVGGGHDTYSRAIVPTGC